MLLAAIGASCWVGAFVEPGSAQRNGLRPQTQNCPFGVFQELLCAYTLSANQSFRNSVG